jgi:hypothetical protein
MPLTSAASCGPTPSGVESKAPETTTTGMLTSAVGGAYGFVRSRPELALPDLHLVFETAPFFEGGLGDGYGPAIMFGPILLKPQSSAHTSADVDYEQLMNRHDELIVTAVVAGVFVLVQSAGPF